MSPIELAGRIGVITLNGVDISDHVTVLSTDPSDPGPPLRFTVPKSIRFRSRGGLTPLGHRVLFGRTHPRIRRMHAAYGRRRR
jgi:hypothetical protein